MRMNSEWITTQVIQVLNNTITSEKYLPFHSVVLIKIN